LIHCFVFLGSLIKCKKSTFVFQPRLSVAPLVVVMIINIFSTLCTFYIAELLPALREKVGLATNTPLLLYKVIKYITYCVCTLTIFCCVGSKA